MVRWCLLLDLTLAEQSAKKKKKVRVACKLVALVRQSEEKLCDTPEPSSRVRESSSWGDREDPSFASRPLSVRASVCTRLRSRRRRRSLSVATLLLPFLLFRVAETVLVAFACFEKLLRKETQREISSAERRPCSSTAKAAERSGCCEKRTQALVGAP